MYKRQELNSNNTALEKADKGFGDAGDEAKDLSNSVKKAADTSEDADGKLSKLGDTAKKIGAALGAAAAAGGKRLSSLRAVAGGPAVQADSRHRAGAGDQPAGPRSSGRVGAAAGQRHVPWGNYPAPQLPGSDDPKPQRFQRRATCGGPIPSARR